MGISYTCKGSDTLSIIHHFLFKNNISALLLLFFYATQLYQCHAQEVPSFPLNFNLSNLTYRGNFCERQLQLHNNEISIGDTLKGLNISIFLTEASGTSDAFLFALSEEGAIPETDPGLMVEILDEVAKRAEFSWRNSFSTGRFHDTSFQSYTKLLHWSTNNYDISADYWDRSLERIALGIGFPHSWFQNDAIMIAISVPETESNIFGFLQPFKPIVWIMVFITIVLSGIAYFCLVKLEGGIDQTDVDVEDQGDETYSSLKRVASSVYMSAMAFTGNFSYEPLTFASRLWSVSLAFWVLLVTSAYTANLASFLVSKNSKTFGITTMEEAVLKQAPVCVLDKTNTDVYFTLKYPEATFVRKEDTIGMIEAMRNKECEVSITGKAVYDALVVDEAFNKDCGIVWVGYILKPIPSGFATAVDTGNLCTSLVYHVLDIYLMEMYVDGFINKKWKKYLKAIGTHECDSSVENTNTKTALTLDDMKGIFIIHLATSVIAIILTIVSNRKSYRSSCM